MTTDQVSKSVHGLLGLVLFIIFIGEPVSHGDSFSPRLVSDNSLNLQTLLVEIEQIQNATIAKTIQRLAQRYPKHLEKHTLAYKSKSLQAASFDQPRVIVFGDDAHFIFAFNGTDGSFEVVTFDEASTKFEFREIQLKAEGGRPSVSKNEIEFETKNAIVSVANPSRCLDCHGHTRPRPIFENYFLWPGFYGSIDDGLFREPKAPSANRALKLIGRDVEKEAWLQFQKDVRAGAKHTERYQHLPDISKSREAIYGETESFRPNVSLNLKIHKMAMQQLAHDLALTPKRRALAEPLADYISCSNESMRSADANAYRQLAILPDQYRNLVNLQSTAFLHQANTVNQSVLSGMLSVLLQLQESYGTALTPSYGFMNADLFESFLELRPSHLRPELIPTLGGVFPTLSEKNKSLAVVQTLLASVHMSLTDYSYDSKRTPLLVEGASSLNSLRPELFKLGLAKRYMKQKCPIYQ